MSRTAPDAAPLLEIRDLSRYFDASAPLLERLLHGRERAWVKAVDGVSFTVNRGETLGLVGESGSGKSTTCRVVLQLLKPTSGSVKFEGREIAGGADRPAARDARLHAAIEHRQ